MSNQTDRLNAALADRYHIVRELGAGGMATVYLAHDIKHDRQVAVKVVKPELGAVLGAERFLYAFADHDLWLVIFSHTERYDRLRKDAPGAALFARSEAW